MDNYTILFWNSRPHYFEYVFFNFGKLYQVTLTHNFCEIFQQEPSPASPLKGVQLNKFLSIAPQSYFYLEVIPLKESRMELFIAIQSGIISIRAQLSLLNPNDITSALCKLFLPFGSGPPCFPSASPVCE